MKPFGFVTNEGKLVKSDIMERYATKDASSRRLTDKFEKTYQRNKLVSPLYNPEQLANIVEVNTFHSRACRTKARDVAGLGWDLKREDDADRDDTAEETAVREWFEMLNPPIEDTLTFAQTDYETVGWGCLELIREDYAPNGPPSKLVHIPSHTIRVHKDGDKYLQIRGTRRVWFKDIEADFDLDWRTGQAAPIGEMDPSRRATELMFWKNYTSRSDYYGLPDIIPAIGAVHGDAARRDYNIAFFNNYGVPAYAVFITGDFDDDTEVITDSDGNEIESSDMEETIQEHFKELSKHPHSTLVLTIPGTDVNIQFQPLSVDVKEASFRLYRQDNRDEVLNAHGIPAYRTGVAVAGQLGGEASEHMTEIYKSSVVEPRQATLERLVNRYIIRGAFDVATLKFKFSEIDNTDEAHEMDMWKSLYEMKAVDGQDVRMEWAERFNLDKERLPERDDVDDETVDAVFESFSDRMLDIAHKDVKYAEQWRSRAEASEASAESVRQNGSAPANPVTRSEG